MTDAEQVQAEIESAAQARQEMESLRRRHAGASQHADATERTVAELRTKLVQEDADVEKLESFSPTRIWAGLKGTRASDLDRESAERDAARYAVASAEARRDMAHREREALEEQLRALGDVESAYRSALEHKDAWVRANDTGLAAQLAEIAEQRGALVAQDKEAREAHAAGLSARDHLRAAGELLGSARSWSNWDTFGGGGLLTDMMKYDRLDDATEALRRADHALEGFTRELADVGMTGVGGVEIDNLTRAFDVFFDNIFSDMAVRSRIQDASTRVSACLEAVERALRSLEQRGQEIAAGIAGLDTRREQALLA